MRGDRDPRLEVATHLVPRLAAAAAFILYTIWAPPSFYWLDSGELAAAGVGLGVAHPTGFPLYVMIARLASLVPVGELAFRVNLVSALAAAVAVAAVARLVIAAGGSKVPAVVGGAASAAILAASLLLVRHATSAEVYAPTAAVLALTLLLVDRVARGGDARHGLALAVVCGLGLGLHSIYRLLVPLPVIALLWVRLRRGARWPLYAPVVTLSIAAALQLQMPARSATDRVAALDWGHPDELGATWDHLTARRIRASFGDEIMSDRPVVVAEHGRQLAVQIADGLGPLALLLALAGAVWLVSRRRHWFLFAAIACVVAIDAIYSVWINPMGLRDGQNATALAVAAAALAGLGLAWGSARLGRAAPWAGAVIAVIAALPPLLISAAEVGPGAAGEMARRWSEAALDQLPPRAVALTRSDSLSAGLLFLTAAEGARPDVTVLVRQHLADGERVEALLGASVQRRVEIDRARPLAAVLASGRPAFWELADDAPPPGTGVGVPLAPVAGGGDIAASAANLARLFADSGADPLARRELARSVTTLGRIAFAGGELDRAAALFDAAIAARPTHAEALVNRGAVHARRGDLEAAAAITERALAIEPNRVTALINAARYRAALGDRDQAGRHARRALAVDPSDRRATALLEGLDTAPEHTEPSPRSPIAP